VAQLDKNKITASSVITQEELAQARVLIEKLRNEVEHAEAIGPREKQINLEGLADVENLINYLTQGAM
jgi:anti-sigma regulatory factor (Ser/Thr protein kinase)